jgi:hypothetical protein
VSEETLYMCVVYFTKREFLEGRWEMVEWIIECMKKREVSERGGEVVEGVVKGG